MNDPEAIRMTVPGRFPLPMLEEWPEVLKHASFHRQFIALTRAHAQLIRNDTFVFDLFTRHCFKAIEGWGAAAAPPHPLASGSPCLLHASATTAPFRYHACIGTGCDVRSALQQPSLCSAAVCDASLHATSELSRMSS